eukprot:TRINITY_DN24157_c0_g1_i1.p1 TRINITY_DN24157_c0_g1~~TRINITY_DN24157_c0_g1_i1.p1  ORF type:complete len:462 (-),score=62.05 TRINITY_DN24157_c0_g1_i1:431-1816(-)
MLGQLNCCLLLRSIVITALTFYSASRVVRGLAARSAQRAAWQDAALDATLCFASIALYWYELCRRRVWASARCALVGKSFATMMDDLRNAAPLIDLESPGLSPVPYTVAEWKDETSWVEANARCRLKQEGLLLASFPLEFVPGDHAEAEALNFAKSQLAEKSLDAPAQTALLGNSTASTEGLRLRLRWPGGLETEAPESQLLFAQGMSSQVSVDANPAVDHFCPCALMLCSCCLLGLLLDVCLLACAQPVEFPIRKRFYTLQGSDRLGVLRFSCSPSGNVEIEGMPDELKTANRFWIQDEERWTLVHKEVLGLAPVLLGLLWLRRICLAIALFLAASFVAGFASNSRLFGGGSAHPMPLTAAGAVCCLVGTWIADRASECRTRASAESLARELPGGASINVSWSSSSVSGNGENAACSCPSLSGDSIRIEVGQRTVIEGSPARELPVLKNAKVSSMPLMCK